MLHGGMFGCAELRFLHPVSDIFFENTAFQRGRKTLSFVVFEGHNAKAQDERFKSIFTIIIGS